MRRQILVYKKIKKDKVLEALKVLNRQQLNQEETESPEEVHFKAEQVLKFTPQKTKKNKTRNKKPSTPIDFYSTTVCSSTLRLKEEELLIQNKKQNKTKNNKNAFLRHLTLFEQMFYICTFNHKQHING